MALIRCPECNHENVSNSAEVCPNCGYGIKAHFDRIEKANRDRLKREQEKLCEIQFEKNMRELENKRLSEIPMPSKPKYPLWAAISALALFGLAATALGYDEWDIQHSISNHKGDPRVQSVIVAIMAMAILVFGFYFLSKKKNAYTLSKENPDEYRRQMLKKEDDKFIRN